MTMHSTVSQFATMTLLAMAFAMSAYADEPNEDFNSATVLAPGVFSILDELTASDPINPDTVLGNRDQFGEIEFTNDDDSPVGDGVGSALFDLPTNSGSISFAVSGYDDFDFVGAHSESGNYEVFVDVHDIFDDLVDSFSSGIQMLEQGSVDEYSYFDFTWIGGSYDVYIDNGSQTITDIDFLTFTGLTPGTSFAAHTSDPDGSEIDTFLGWFNNLGELIESDDDDAGDLLSLIEGIVPDEGELTFAVTGCCDDGFIGQHSQSGAYGLELKLNPSSHMGDYNANGIVDGADYPAWRDSVGAFGNRLAADGNGNGQIDAGDYDVWKLHFGETAGNAAAANAISTVPEPTTLALLAAGMLALLPRRCGTVS